MVLLVITSNIASALESLPQPTREQLSLPAPVRNEPISHAQLISLSRSLSSHIRQAEQEDRKDASCNEEEGETSYSLNSLLRGTKVYVPPPPPKPEPSAEYLALKAKLQAEAESRKYNALLHSPSPAAFKRQASPIFAPSSTPSYLNSNPGTGAGADADADADSDPLTPSVALNILISILFTGFATYWALSNFRTPASFTFAESRSYPGALSSQPFRVFVALLAAIGVGIAEVVVYAAYWRKVMAAKEKERNVVEKKVVVGKFGKGSEGSAHGDSDGEGGSSVGKVKESVEIWGKGPNRGARRRVRERWKEREDKE